MSCHAIAPHRISSLFIWRERERGRERERTSLESQTRRRVDTESPKHRRAVGRSANASSHVVASSQVSALRKSLMRSPLSRFELSQPARQQQPSRQLSQDRGHPHHLSDPIAAKTLHPFDTHRPNSTRPPDACACRDQTEELQPCRSSLRKRRRSRRPRRWPALPLPPASREQRATLRTTSARPCPRPEV